MSSATEPSNKESLKIGTVIDDKWVILGLIGKGAMGEVYRAHQLNLQRDVAIKVISRQWLESFEEGDPEVENSLLRFRREVQAMARIRHPCVLQVYDHGTVPQPQDVEKTPLEYIVMEYIPGNSLRYTMSEEGFYPEEDLLKEWLTRYFMPVLNGVEAVHLLDIIHRDLKPENILMDGDTPKIADFGLARSKRLKPVTQSMDMKGTLHYMSPEHFFDFRKADHRADIYSLGKILFEAVNGKFREKTTPFRQVSLPEADSAFFTEVNEIIKRATAEKKEDRFKSVAELRGSIKNALMVSMPEGSREGPAVEPTTRFRDRPTWIWTGVAIAVLSMAAMTAWHLLGEPGKNAAVSVTPAESQEGSVSGGPPDASTMEDKSDFTDSGAVFRSIPGGHVVLPASGDREVGQQVNLGPFQIEAAPVTNHQYIEFLNSQLSTLTIARDVVRDEDEIWIMLGEIFEGYEPVVFRKGRFHLKDAAYAAHPVLRVTPYGAAAYAAYYGRRLPSMAEWYRAVGIEPTGSDDTAFDPNPSDMAEMHESMMARDQKPGSDTRQDSRSRPESVGALRQNKHDIRLMPQGFGEWALLAIEQESDGNLLKADAVIMPDGVKRKPWEAFEEVGFRCVRPVKDAPADKKQAGDASPGENSPAN